MDFPLAGFQAGRLFTQYEGFALHSFIVVPCIYTHVCLSLLYVPHLFKSHICICPFVPAGPDDVLFERSSSGLTRGGGSL